MKPFKWTVFKLNGALLVTVFLAYLFCLGLHFATYQDNLLSDHPFNLHETTINVELESLNPLPKKNGFSIHAKEYDVLPVIGRKFIVFPNYKGFAGMAPKTYQLDYYEYDLSQAGQELGEKKNIDLLPLLKKEGIPLEHLVLSQVVYLEDGKDVIEIRYSPEDSLYYNIEKGTLTKTRPKDKIHHFDKETELKFEKDSPSTLDLTFYDNGLPTIIRSSSLVDQSWQLSHHEPSNPIFLVGEKMSDKDVLEIMSSFSSTDEESR